MTFVRGIWTGGVLLGVLIAGVPASAQRTGTRIGRDATATDGVLAMRLIAECYVDRRPQIVRAWLAALPGSPEEEKIARSDLQSVEDCMKGDQLVMDGKEITFRAGAMRRPLAMAMARQLLKREASPPVPAAESKLWFEGMIKPAAGGNAGFNATEITWQEIGSCVVEARWKESVELLETDFDTPREKTAIDAIVPAIGPCIPNGTQLSLKRDMVRYIVAEPVYHFIVGDVAPMTAADAK